jgi:hypothetical protein
VRSDQDERWLPDGGSLVGAPQKFARHPSVPSEHLSIGPVLPMLPPVCSTPKSPVRRMRVYVTEKRFRRQQLGTTDRYRPWRSYTGGYGVSIRAEHRNSAQVSFSDYVHIMCTAATTTTVATISCAGCELQRAKSAAVERGGVGVSQRSVRRKQ